MGDTLIKVGIIICLFAASLWIVTTYNPKPLPYNLPYCMYGNISLPCHMDKYRYEDI